MAIDYDVAWSVNPYPVNEIRELVEPVICTGGEGEDHEATEADVLESGPGYVLYTCPTCETRVLYRHGKGQKAPCCGQRG